MNHRYLFASLAILAAQAGCNRNDADCLSRAGQKVVAHARHTYGDLGGKVDVPFLGSKREPTLQEKIHDRLRFDKALKDVPFEVHVKDKEVELKATLTNPEQRQRAIELAESVVGVEKVNDATQLREPMPE